MSKIDKVRVKGVLYDLGGSGGSGSISGYYVFPLVAISHEQLGFEAFDIDFSALKDHLVQNGVDLTEIAIDGSEEFFGLDLFPLTYSQNDFPFIGIAASRGEADSGIKGRSSSTMYSIEVKVLNQQYSFFTISLDGEMTVEELLDYIQDRGNTQGSIFFVPPSYETFKMHGANGVLIGTSNNSKIYVIANVEQVLADIVVESEVQPLPPTLPTNVAV